MLSSDQTESIDADLLDLDLQPSQTILSLLLASQHQAIVAVANASAAINTAIDEATNRLSAGQGRIVLVGAGASGRIAIQDGAELWPTFGWPATRLLLCMAGGDAALLHSVEGAEDDHEAACTQVREKKINGSDVVVAVAASGSSPWTCAYLKASRQQGALTIGMANNSGTPLLSIAHCPILLETGAEVLAGSTRMAAGTAQKVALNNFSTTLMIRLNRTYGNLMVDMAATNQKLDARRIRLLQGVLPDLAFQEAQEALEEANGWVKLAVLIAKGDTASAGKKRLDLFGGSLREALASIND